MIIRDDDVAIVPAVGTVDKIDGAKGRFRFRGGDGVVCDGGSRSTIDYNSTIGGASDLYSRSQ